MKTRSRKKAKHASCVTCEHNIFTHFPKDPLCEICIAGKPTRGQCRTTGPVRVDALPPPKEWLDAVTLDHKIISEADKSADGHRAACVVCDRATYWIQGYPAEHKNEADTVSALVEFAGPQGRAKHIYSDNSKEINAACTTGLKLTESPKMQSRKSPKAHHAAWFSPVSVSNVDTTT